MCAILVPVVYLGALLVALLVTRSARVPQWSGRLLRWTMALRPWAMPEVLLLGTLVAYVKIRELADSSPQAGMLAIAGVVGLNAWLHASLDWTALWQRIRTAP